ncbi:hypothetical protein JMJ35_000992 [Cladonia borealis]|uniref:Protein kinase domain-containing protein n=1 Tax=Cladonia borealis TaxID=184061 RepID=A0AA39V7H5_9LECA|nr:hypothetical protein JMJ35_000992 [Cladonia borealis]
MPNHEALGNTVDLQQPMSLAESARECLGKLQTLKKGAKKSRQFHGTASTRDLLQNVERSIDGSLHLLHTWITEFKKGRQTNNDETVVPVRQVFGTLQQNIDDAKDALSARLQYRTILFVGFIKKKKRKRLEARLDRELQNIFDTIGVLHTQLKLLVDSSRQSDRQFKKQDVLEGTNQVYKTFKEYFKNHNVQGERRFRSSVLNLLWTHIPIIEDLEGKVGNTEDPGDGIMYGSEEVVKTTLVLRTLCQAWLEAGDSAPCPAPENLQEMAKICLILAGMKQPRLLEDFIDSNIVDKDLGTLKKEQVQTILKSHHALCTATFIAEQYRAVPRDWEEGNHVELEDEEPLPLIYEHTYMEGSSGLVTRVRDPISHKTYALKKQIIASEETRTAAARNHLEQEIKRLKGLNHIHVVQLVKLYERGGAYGLILKPAATCDLVGLLGRYNKNKYNTITNCRDREWIRPILLTAFGCLSKGLAYIHGCNIRHKDVKPGNILYEREIRNVNKGPRFIWADFGLAHDFSASQDSRTRSSKIYSPRYAAPEVVAMNDLANNKRTYSDKRTIVLNSLDRIVENGEERSIDDDLDSETAEDMLNSHGRKTDIFSLGCVFLELLGGLIDEKLPLDAPNSQPPREFPIFARYVLQLQEWAQQLQASDSGPEIAPLFKIASDMISIDPKRRPEVGEVVKRVTAVGRQNFCHECWAEIPVQDKPDHSQIPKPLNRAPTSPVNKSPTGSVLKRVNSTLSQHAVPQLRRILSR